MCSPYQLPCSGLHFCPLIERVHIKPGCSTWCWDESWRWMKSCQSGSALSTTFPLERKDSRCGHRNKIQQMCVLLSQCRRWHAAFLAHAPSYVLKEEWHYSALRRKKKMEKMGNRGNNENLPLGEMRFFVLHCIIFSHRYRWTHYKQYHNKNEIFSSRYYTMSLLIYQGSGVIFRILNKI